MSENPLPPLRPGSPATNGFKHKNRFGLIIETADEASQAALFERLKELGLQARVVTV
ncbi:MAG: hypothetical protein MUF14_05650 [Hyphomonadaceae bacterium]|jgi:hypothetical protein|nr:hypothetical protein [Hyphomonadaceae bacterium]